MAGLYIHVPFCNEKCYYCDFYSGNQLYLIDDYVQSISMEIQLRRGYIADNEINTIYFGGGTPSLLTKLQLSNIFKSINETFNVDPLAEITIECNPENISKEYVDDLWDCGFNRISLGVQFLDDDILKKFNRQHSIELIFNAITIINHSRFSNLSVDLIYSVPGISDESLMNSIKQLFQFDIKHFSVYSLTIANNTKLYWKIKKGDIIENKEDVFLAQYYGIQNLMESNDFFQYEVSNYAKEGYISLHNLAYWNQVLYIGLGVSAHSYNHVSRQWNHTNIKKYIRDLSNDKIDFEIEFLTDIQKYNEYIILRLRTFLGISNRYIQHNFDKELQNHFFYQMKKLKLQNHFISEGDLDIPLKSDLLLADHLAKILMF